VSEITLCVCGKEMPVDGVPCHANAVRWGAQTFTVVDAQIDGDHAHLTIVGVQRSEAAQVEQIRAAATACRNANDQPWFQWVPAYLDQLVTGLAGGET
jgi:hypothetical protein